ncbi:T9SS type A sorting domain-containing protein [Winogradskyella sp. PE311]|uniref:T9SS type A sorting domain-containing protein n=1 Tax=Winogradskyella sp. PE311 TaxID=3366943 RepID=UPI0039812D41
MKSLYFIFNVLCSVILVNAQQFTLETPLDAAINETSGLLYLNNTLITHNDSANTNQLFEIDTTTGNITRTVTLTNATNIDWEDLTHDDTYIYIGDFGNNQGDRLDLKIYRITIADYFANTSVTADVINFSYSNQTDFTSSPFATNFDAEGIIHYNDALYIFSKNWIDGDTNIYQLPKTPGTYSANSIDTINVQGLISGATTNTSNTNIVLTGYDLNGSFLIELSGFNSGIFSNGTVTKTAISVPSNYSAQIEGIIAINTNEYYVSAEENTPDASGLYSINLSTLSSQIISSSSLYFYPNPAQNNITINKDNTVTKIYTTLGQLVKSSTKKQIIISDLVKGIYLIQVEDNLNKKKFIKRLIID